MPDKLLAHPDKVIEAVVHESGSGRLCCKSRFALGFKNSEGCGRGFRVEM